MYVMITHVWRIVTSFCNHLIFIYPDCFVPRNDVGVYRHCEERSNPETIPVRQYRYRKFAGLLLWGGLMFLISSCIDDEILINVDEPKLPDGELIAVNFTVGKIEYDDREVVSRSSSPLGGVNGDNDAPVKLRSAQPLDPGVIVRIVAYAGISYDTYYGFADYEVMYGGLLTPFPSGAPELSVPMGTFNFVAYSFNNNDPMPAYAQITGGITSKDVLWGDSVATITSVSQQVHITMNHLMTKVVIRATTGLTSTDFLNSAEAAILCYEPTLDVQDGTLIPGGSLTEIPFSWTITDPSLSTQISDTLYVFTDEENTTHLRIDHMFINNNKYTGPFNITYHKPLEAGKSYELLVHFRWARGGYSDRITWESPSVTYPAGRYIITRDPTDAGLYFKFGSVVGLFSDVEAGAGKILTLPGQSNSIPASDTVFLASRDIAWSPFQKIVSDSWAWNIVPVYDAYPKLVTPEAGYHTVDSVKEGKGDPCRLVGMDLSMITSAASLTNTDIDNGLWRLPTVQENEWFTEGTFGISTSVHWWDYTGSLFFPLYPISPFAGVAGAEFPERSSGVVTEARKAKFLPAAGGRNPANGNISTISQGIIGQYWSNQSFYNSLPPGTARGNLFEFFPFAVSSDLYSVDANWGSSVRCVRQTMNFEITVDDWIFGANFGPGNFIL